jgi:hypothetical protein
MCKGKDVEVSFAHVAGKFNSSAGAAAIYY